VTTTLLLGPVSVGVGAARFIEGITARRADEHNALGLHLGTDICTDVLSAHGITPELTTRPVYLLSVRSASASSSDLNVFSSFAGQLHQPEADGDSAEWEASTQPRLWRRASSLS
jgi:hypothetical protein